MGKKLNDSSIKEAFEKLAEAARNNGKSSIEGDIKKTLKEWNGMDNLLRREDASLTDVIERWGAVRKLMSTVLQGVASFSSPGTVSTPAPVAKSVKSRQAASSSSSSDEPDSSSEESSSEGSSSEESSSEESKSKNSSSDESSSAESDSSESDSNSESSSATDDSESEDASPKAKIESAPISSVPKSSVSSSSSSGSDSDSDSSSSSSVSDSSEDSELEREAPPKKKRRSEENKNPSESAPERLEKRKENANEKPAMNGALNKAATTGSAEKPAVMNNHLKSDRQVIKRPRKSNAPFQRIKAESIQFADERLKDNSFYSRGAKHGDYGERAHADLIVTRGDGFRKEKNKKKRGSYRGGEITLESHSIKFT